MISKKANNLTSFLSSFLALIQDKDVVTELQALIEETPVKSQPKRTVKHVKKKIKMRNELRMTA